MVCWATKIRHFFKLTLEENCLYILHIMILVQKMIVFCSISKRLPEELVQTGWKIDYGDLIDADYTSSVNDRRSTSGYCTLLCRNLVSWRNKKQSVLTRSSAEAELSYGAEYLSCMNIVLDHFQIKYEPLWTYRENRSALCIAQSFSVWRDKTHWKILPLHQGKIDWWIDNNSQHFVRVWTSIAEVLTKRLAKIKIQPTYLQVGNYWYPLNRMTWSVVTM